VGARGGTGRRARTEPLPEPPDGGLPDAPEAADAPRPFGAGRAALVLLLTTLLVLGDVLLVAEPEVLSHGSADLALQYVHWRDFGFGELARGNLALWNPHVYLGAPYFGGLQSALLYPPNWIYLVLPLPHAINWGIASHVFLLGFLTFAWVRRRGD